MCRTKHDAAFLFHDIETRRPCSICKQATTSSNLSSSERTDHPKQRGAPRLRLVELGLTVHRLERVLALCVPSTDREMPCLAFHHRHHEITWRDRRRRQRLRHHAAHVLHVRYDIRASAGIRGRAFRLGRAEVAAAEVNGFHGSVSPVGCRVVLSLLSVAVAAGHKQLISQTTTPGEGQHASALLAHSKQQPPLKVLPLRTAYIDCGSSPTAVPTAVRLL